MTYKLQKWTMFLVLLTIVAMMISPMPIILHADKDDQRPQNNFMPFPPPPFLTDDPNTPKGLIINEKQAFHGYTLIAPTMSTETYLIDMDGRVVNSWHSEYPPGQSAYLLENGNLLRTGSSGMGNGTFHGGGAGGRIQEFTWAGQLVLDFEYSTDDYLSHHDIEKLPNGNILLIAWEKKTQDQAIAAGRDPELVSEQGMWSDYIVEIKPTGKSTAQIVWQWHVWDHLIQDLDPRKQNYGVVKDHPELVNLNPPDWMEKLTDNQRSKLESLGYISKQQPDPMHNNPDWNHTNSIDYNPHLDQIILSVLNFNEIWVIDHSTTTEQASSHSGGKYGKGGDLLYRWGNPKSYGAGELKDQMLFAQHDAHWIPDGLKGAGNILIFNNGRGRSNGDYSSIEEISPPVNNDGTYKLKTGESFGPTKTVWTYTAENKEDFFSTNVSGAQRLPNGNTLICSGAEGIIFEVTPKGNIVWKYINPANPQMNAMPMGPGRFGPPGANNRGPRPGGGPGRNGFSQPPKEFSEKMRTMGMPPNRMPKGHGPGRTLFRAYRYSADYPAFKDKKLIPGKTIEEMQKANP